MVERSQADGSPPRLNGDIAIQLEWSKFDPWQNQNPLTDYDQTLHNWLRTRAEQVTQTLCQLVSRVRLGKYVKYNTKIYFIFIFPRTCLLKRPVDGFWRTIFHNTPKTAINRQKIGHFMREVDNREEWRHRRMPSMAPRRLRCCKSIVQGQITDHSFTACMLVRQIHTKFSRNQGNFIVNVKSEFIWMYQKMMWRYLTN